MQAQSTTNSRRGSGPTRVFATPDKMSFAAMHDALAMLLRHYFQVSPPTLASLSGFDKGADGTLNLEQSWFSGKFVSAKLEEEYCKYIYAIWRPRLRAIATCLICFEIYALLSSIECSCGRRFGVYHGPLLVYTYAFPSGIVLLFCVLLSPKLSNKIAKRAAELLAVLVCVVSAGYLIPTTVFLRFYKTSVFNLHNASHNASASGLAIDLPNALTNKAAADAAVWYMSTVYIALVAGSTGVTGLGLGPVALGCFCSVPFTLFMLYSISWFEVNLGFVPDIIWVRSEPELSPILCALS